MKNNIVKLSVHRNTQEQRRKHLVSDQLRVEVKRATRFKDLEGYALVAWTKGKDGSLWAMTAYQGGTAMQPRNIPEFVRSHLEQNVFDGVEFQALGPLPPDKDGA